MVTALTREQAIRKVKRLRRVAALRMRLRSLFKGRRPAPLGKEVFIETEHGKVRTLWYGFDDPETAPLFFDLHGGGFVFGSADMDEAINLELRARVGCKIISIDYAKAPEAPYPAAVNQIDAVVAHVFENAATYGVDPERMAIGGHSAGGNLSAVACLQAKRAGQVRFVGQVLDYPVLDLGTSPLRQAPAARAAFPRTWRASLMPVTSIRRRPRTPASRPCMRPRRI
jgi:acetyl esterase